MTESVRATQYDLGQKIAIATLQPVFNLIVRLEAKRARQYSCRRPGHFDDQSCCVP